MATGQYDLFLPAITLLCQNIQKKEKFMLLWFSIWILLATVTSLFALIRTWAGPISAPSLCSQTCLRPMSKFKLRTLQFCLLPWVTVYLSSCSAAELARRQMGAGSMPVLSMWLHGCWVSNSYDIQVNLGHNISDREVLGDCGHRIGGILVMHGLYQAYVMDCFRVRVSPLSQWH